MRSDHIQRPFTRKPVQVLRTSADGIHAGSPQFSNQAIAAYQRTQREHAGGSRSGGGNPPPRQELFRLLNMGPDGTASIISMRQDLRGMLADHPNSDPSPGDVVHLLQSWFNRGFCDRAPSAGRHRADSEKHIAYESVARNPGMG